MDIFEQQALLLRNVKAGDIMVEIEEIVQDSNPDVPEDHPSGKDLIGDSILQNVKKQIGIMPDVDVFDTDIMGHINSALFSLMQLGIGPEEGFFIEDAEATFSDFLGEGNPRRSPVLQYLVYNTRLGFDTPSNSYVIDSITKKISELEWRLLVSMERPYLEKDPDNL